ncbi:transposase-like protein [Sporomusaceae bacterium BoRhaA]|nr:transposase-like protein [Pelorhabdus rhamnosifermentans]
MADLKLVYGAPPLDDAAYRLEEFRETWGKKYPQIVKSWEANWTELSTYFKYPKEVRRLIYTTNAVEGFHRMLRKYTKTKTIYPTDDAVRNSVFIAFVFQGSNQKGDTLLSIAALPNLICRSGRTSALPYPAHE